MIWRTHIIGLATATALLGSVGSADAQVPACDQAAELLYEVMDLGGVDERLATPAGLIAAPDRLMIAATLFDIAVRDFRENPDSTRAHTIMTTSDTLLLCYDSDRATLDDDLSAQFEEFVSHYPPDARNSLLDAVRQERGE